MPMLMIKQNQILNNFNTSMRIFSKFLKKFKGL